MKENGTFRFSLFVRGDIDGFIGLFIDNLVNLILIVSLFGMLGMEKAMFNDLVFGKILPATALSVLAGNIFYSWQARKLALLEKRDDVTALPYGINTVSLIAFFFLIILPIAKSTGNPYLAWKVGVACCFVSGICEGLGAFVGKKIRAITPRAALLSTLAGIAIVFLSLQFTIKIWDKPLIAFIPLAFILVEYFSHVKLPFRIPAGLYALVIGSIIAWSLGDMKAEKLTASVAGISFYLPTFTFGEIITGINEIKPYLSIAIPMGIMSFFGTLQNIESAAAAGDSYPERPSLLMNGIGTVVGSFFGSPFPTTVYIGHPGWKGLGARAGYSIINGAVITILCLTGLISAISNIIPIEAGYPILLWIGVVITAQAFQTTPKEHAPAVALGLMPAIAAWGMVLLGNFLYIKGEAGTIIQSIIAQNIPEIKGFMAFSEGALFSAMFLTAVAVYMIEKDFLKAFYWTLPLIICSFFGLIHSSQVGINVAGNIPLGYVLFGITILLIYAYNRFADKKVE